MLKYFTSARSPPRSLHRCWQAPSPPAEIISEDAVSDLRSYPPALEKTGRRFVIPIIRTRSQGRYPARAVSYVRNRAFPVICCARRYFIKTHLSHISVFRSSRSLRRYLNLLFATGCRFLHLHFRAQLCSCANARNMRVAPKKASQTIYSLSYQYLFS